jgi:GNAT superfamily N-acetyltransferase
MVQSIAAKQTLLLRDANSFEPLGTITFSTEGDPDFWTEEERAVPSLYLAKLATRTDSAGQGLGRLMLDYALYYAVAQRLKEVRMDVWKTATNLHEYYRMQGWTYLRTVEKPGRFSGALFTRHVEPPKVNLPPRGLQVSPPAGTLGEYAYRELEVYGNSVLHFDG